MQRSKVEATGRMEEKSKTSASGTKKIEGKKVVEFVGEVKQELKRIEWTDKEELKAYTKIVLVSTFLFGMLVYFGDLVIQGFLNTFNFLIKAIF